ncbi:5-methylthioadenosine/S-adenosylhomocysteine deaminase [Rhizobium sp. PP-WC-1G-195]|nr:5-methylthioadenosine/S-adenosylhomocysteine deaminase [Rhizobium sp. PP-WC-1G-195]
MTETLFRNALILTMAPGSNGATPSGDVLVRDGRIISVGTTVIPTPDMVIIEAAGKLIMPGLVNAHTHSSETFFRGRYERMPLEVWLLYAYPLLVGTQISPRLLYLRTLLLAMESLRSGVTTLCDDFFDVPGHDVERLATVFSAYEASGIRANISSAVMNIPTLDALPFAREIVPPELQRLLDGNPQIRTDEYIAFCKEIFSTLHGRAGRLQFMIAPSAPQRCTPDLIQACHALARDKSVPFHTHVVETKTQAVTGQLLYGKSLIRHLHDLGALDRHTTIAHSVWVNDADIELMGAARCSVAHNAVSNQKLGAGIAPIRRLLEAGVTVGLGTDGVCSNDTARILDVMRTAALIHGVSGPDPEEWLTANEILHAATLGGARTALLDHVTGSLEPGKAADIIMLDLDTYAFQPFNDAERQIVFSENGSSIKLVMVAGEVVVRDRKLVTIDEAAIFQEIRETVPELLAEHGEVERRNRIFEPWFAEIHRRASLVDVGMNRYAGDMPFWRRN